VSAYRGPQGKGMSRNRRAQKGQEAEARNAVTQHHRTKRHRLGKCGCSTTPETMSDRKANIAAED